VLSSITGYGTIDFGKSSDECDFIFLKVGS
jgi:hypothetical protein